MPDTRPRQSPDKATFRRDTRALKRLCRGLSDLMAREGRPVRIEVQVNKSAPWMVRAAVSWGGAEGFAHRLPDGCDASSTFGGPLEVSRAVLDLVTRMRQQVPADEDVEPREVWP